MLRRWRWCWPIGPSMNQPSVSCAEQVPWLWGNLADSKISTGAFEHLLFIQSGMIVCNGLIFFVWIELNWTMLKPTTTYSIVLECFRYASIHFLGTQCWPITLPMHQVVCAVKFGVAKQLCIGRRCSTLLPLVGYIILVWGHEQLFTCDFAVHQNIRGFEPLSHVSYYHIVGPPANAPSSSETLLMDTFEADDSWWPTSLPHWGCTSIAGQFRYFDRPSLLGLPNFQRVFSWECPPATHLQCGETMLRLG